MTKSPDVAFACRADCQQRLLMRFPYSLWAEVPSSLPVNFRARRSSRRSEILRRTTRRRARRKLPEASRAYIGKAADGSEAHIGPNDQVLDLIDGAITGRTTDRGRLIITGHLGFLRGHVPHDLKRHHTITVDQRKPPDVIAHEIQRRLLPAYETAL